MKMELSGGAQLIESIKALDKKQASENNQFFFFFF